tara:strand:- start:1102 stop:1818 length:717 start_codon:yes stop_codon:yes gene_type:complete
MMEQTEQGALFDAGKTPKTNELQNNYIERLERIFAQVKQSGSPEAPKAAIKLNKARHDLLMRSVEAMAREISQFGEAEIKELSAKSDPGMLVKLVHTFLTDSPFDRTTRMALKGAERFRALLEKFGGTVTTKWVCEFLGISEAAVRKRAHRNALLARRMPNGELSFPAFQFDESSGGLVRGMQAFLSHVNSWPVDEIVRFLLVRHTPEISNDNPLELLKQSQLKRVIDLADMHLTQRP